MLYILTDSTFNLLINRLLNRKLKKIHIYHEDTKFYFEMVDIHTLDERFLDEKEIKKAIEELNKFYLYYSLGLIKKYELKVDFLLNEHELIEDYTCSTENLKLAEELKVHIDKSIAIAEHLKLNKIEISGLYDKNYKSYKKTTIPRALKKISKYL